MGRRPTPTAAKRLAGTFRKDRASSCEPQPAELATIPDPPAWLTDEGRAAWGRLCAVLVSVRVLTEGDLELLAVLADALGQYEAAALALRIKGSLSFVVYDSDGSPKSIAPWPEIKIQRDTATLIARLAPEFGLSPSSRTRVRALPPPPPDDPWAEFDLPMNDSSGRVQQ